MTSENFLNYIKSSEWYKDEKKRNKVILDFIEKLNNNNTLHKKIILVNSLFDMIKSSNEKISSDDNFKEFVNDENKDYSYDCSFDLDFIDNNNYDYYFEAPTGITSQNYNNDLNVFDDDIFNKFIFIKDNINSDNTVNIRIQAFDDLMKFINQDYKLSDFND